MNLCVKRERGRDIRETVFFLSLGGFFLGRGGGVGVVRTPTLTLVSPQYYHLCYPLGDYILLV